MCSECGRIGHHASRCPDEAPPATVVCPICGWDKAEVHINKITREVVGCEECLPLVDVVEYIEERYEAVL